jgi:hypothetical protein
MLSLGGGAWELGVFGGSHFRLRHAPAHQARPPNNPSIHTSVDVWLAVINALSRTVACPTNLNKGTGGFDEEVFII